MTTGKTVKDVSPHDFVKAYAAHLKRSGKIELPPWTDIVKTGVLKELAPYDPDWYYIRAASMARKIYLRGGLGVGAFRRIYGGSKRNGSRPPHFCKSSGGLARHILQQLQTINIVDLDTKGGRKVTSSGQRDLASSWEDRSRSLNARDQAEQMALAPKPLTNSFSFKGVYC